MTKDNGMDVTPSWDELRKSVDILRSMGDALQKERDALDMTRQRLLDERNQALKERDALRREAELHAQEARTQRATVQEIYQLVTGSTGEPGDWNGAEPVRALIEERDALAAHVEEIQSTLDHNFTTDTARVRKLRSVMARGPEASLKSHDFTLGVRFAQEHRAERARRDAEKQAEALDKLRRGLLRNSSAYVLKTLEVEANKLRRQASGGDS